MSVSENRGIDGGKTKGRKRHIVVDVMKNLLSVVGHAANPDVSAKIMRSAPLLKRQRSTRTSKNAHYIHCQKICSVGLSAAERPTAYISPGGISTQTAVLAIKPCFKNYRSKASFGVAFLPSTQCFLRYFA